MGMYTYFVIKGTVKEQYRQKIQELYDVSNLDVIPWDTPDYFEKLVDHVGFDLFKDFKTGERSDWIFFGSRNCDDSLCEYNETTGDWHLEIDMKNYSEIGKPKNSMDMFIDLIPELFEDGLFFSELYEEFNVPSKYELKNGELILTNAKEVKEDREGFMYL